MHERDAHTGQGCDKVGQERRTVCGDADGCQASNAAELVVDQKRQKWRCANDFLKGIEGVSLTHKGETCAGLTVRRR